MKEESQREKAGVVAANVVYVLVMLVVAGITGYQCSWWAGAAVIGFLVVMLAKPRLGGEGGWPF